jgi:tetratricopeptide (TPR) repeat protein
MAQAALDAALQADKVLPGRAAPRVLEGRARAALGQLAEALRALEEAKARDAAAFDDPMALLAWARVLARTGHADRAADAYRSLLPRASALSAAERAAASIEAGLVAMAAGGAGLDEAVAALREGAREAQDEAQLVGVAALALALDRRGDNDEARVLMRERAHGDPRVALSSAHARELLAAAPAEGYALAALALEPTDPTGARDAWDQYLAASPSGPWAAHARAHRASVTSRRKGR